MFMCKASLHHSACAHTTMCAAKRRIPAPTAHPTLTTTHLAELEDAANLPNELRLPLGAGLDQDAVGLVVVDHRLAGGREGSDGGKGQMSWPGLQDCNLLVSPAEPPPAHPPSLAWPWAAPRGPCASRAAPGSRSGRCALQAEWVQRRQQGGGQGGGNGTCWQAPMLACPAFAGHISSHLTHPPACPPAAAASGSGRICARSGGSRTAAGAARRPRSRPGRSSSRDSRRCWRSWRGCSCRCWRYQTRRRTWPETAWEEGLRGSKCAHCAGGGRGGRLQCAVFEATETVETPI